MATKTEDPNPESTSPLATNVPAASGPKSRAKTTKPPEVVHDKAIKTLAPARPRAVSNVPNKLENADQILFSYLTSGLDMMNAITHCTEIPVTVRSSAAQVMINAGLELFRRSNATGTPKGPQDTPQGDAMGVADQLERATKQDLDDAMALSNASPLPDDPPPVDLPEDDLDTWEHASSGEEELPIPGAVIQDGTDAVQSAIQVQRWFRERILEVLKKKGPTPLNQLEDRVVNNTRFQAMDWKQMLQDLINSGTIYREQGRRDNRQFFHLPNQKVPG